VHLVSQYGGNSAERASLEDYDDYAKAYQYYVWLNKALRKTEDAIAPLPVAVVDRAGETIAAHPLTELLAYINDTTTPSEFWRKWINSMFIAGEWFCEIVDDGRGRPAELWWRRPDLMDVLPDDSRPLFPIVAGYYYGGGADILPPETIIHDKFFNPLNPWRGLAPLTAIRESITIDLFAQSWSKAFLKRGARPDYAVFAPEGLTSQERTEYESKLVAKYGGIDNVHRPIVLEQGVTDIKTLSFPPKDIEWLEQRKMSRDEVAGSLGIPDELMGFGKDTYENFSTAWRVWWMMTLKPLIDHRDTALTSYFTRTRELLRPGERIVTDKSTVGALQEELTPKIKNAVILWKFGVPFNTLDERFNLGIGPIPGGDTGYLPGGIVPIERINQPPLQPAQQRAQVAYSTPAHNPIFEQWHKMANHQIKQNRSPGRVFLDDTISFDKSLQLATVLGMCRSQNEVNAIFHHLDFYMATKQALVGTSDNVDPARLDLEDAFVAALLLWFTAHTERILQAARANDGRLPSAAFWKAETAALTTFLIPFLEQWAAEAISQAAVQLNEFALGIDADVNAEAMTWAGQYAPALAASIVGTTKELVKAKLANWLRMGIRAAELTVERFRQELQDTIGPQWRMSLIAATEITRTFGGIALIIAGAVTAIATITWWTSEDERVCPICSPLHGVKRKIGGIFPGGLDAPPAHPRCRCWIVYGI